MSTGNLFNTDIPPAVLADAMAKLAELEVLLNPYYVTISNSDKLQIPKLGDRGEPFGHKTIEFMENEPDYNPPYVDVAETDKDFKNHIRVRPLREKLQGIAQKVTDIGIAAGSDAYIHFLAYYNSVKRAAEMGVPGAQEIFNELRSFFIEPGTGEEPTNGEGTP